MSLNDHLDKLRQENADIETAAYMDTVSYTHLTLPTILLV